MVDGVAVGCVKWKGRKQRKGRTALVAREFSSV